MNVPPPEDVLKDLEDLIKLLFPAFEFGAETARNFFQNYGKPINYSLAPGLVRWGTKDFLAQVGQQVHELETENLANIGLALFFEQFHVRILKTDNGLLPVPGPSRPKQEFYRQQLSFFGAGANSNDPLDSPLNLVFLWDVDRDYFFLGLKLVCPKAGGETRNSVSEYWSTEVPRPDGVVSTPPTSGPYGSGGPKGAPAISFPPADLDYRLKKSEIGKQEEK